MTYKGGSVGQSIGVNRCRRSIFADFASEHCFTPHRQSGSVPLAAKFRARVRRPGESVKCLRAAPVGRRRVSARGRRYTLTRRLYLFGQRKLDRPDGLRTGSPPSPSPQLIRPACGFSCGPRAFGSGSPLRLMPPRLAAWTSFRRSSETRSTVLADIARGNAPRGRW